MAATEAVSQAPPTAREDASQLRLCEQQELRSLDSSRSVGSSMRITSGRPFARTAAAAAGLAGTTADDAAAAEEVQTIMGSGGAAAAAPLPADAKRPAQEDLAGGAAKRMRIQISKAALVPPPNVDAAPSDPHSGASTLSGVGRLLSTDASREYLSSPMSAKRSLRAAVPLRTATRSTKTYKVYSNAFLEGRGSGDTPCSPQIRSKEGMVVQQSAPPLLRGPTGIRELGVSAQPSDSNRSSADPLSARLAAFHRQLSAATAGWPQQQPGSTFATGLGAGGGSVPLIPGGAAAVGTAPGLHPGGGSVPLHLALSRLSGPAARTPPGSSAEAELALGRLPSLSTAKPLGSSAEAAAAAPGGHAAAVGKLPSSAPEAGSAPLGLGLSLPSRGAPLQALAEGLAAAAGGAGPGLGKSVSEDMVSRLNLLVARGEASLVEGEDGLLHVVRNPAQAEEPIAATLRRLSKTGSTQDPTRISPAELAALGAQGSTNHPRSLRRITSGQPSISASPSDPVLTRPTLSPPASLEERLQAAAAEKARSQQAPPRAFEGLATAGPSGSSGLLPSRVVVATQPQLIRPTALAFSALPRPTSMPTTLVRPTPRVVVSSRSSGSGAGSGEPANPFESARLTDPIAPSPLDAPASPPRQTVELLRVAAETLVFMGSNEPFTREGAAAAAPETSSSPRRPRSGASSPAADPAELKEQPPLLRHQGSSIELSLQQPDALFPASSTDTPTLQARPSLVRSGGSGAISAAAHSTRHPSRSPLTGGGLQLNPGRALQRSLSSSHSHGDAAAAEADPSPPLPPNPASNPMSKTLARNPSLVGLAGSGSGAPTSSTHPVLGIRVPSRQRSVSAGHHSGGGSGGVGKRAGSPSEVTTGRGTPSAGSAEAAASQLPPKKRFSTPPGPSPSAPVSSEDHPVSMEPPRSSSTSSEAAHPRTHAPAS